MARDPRPPILTFGRHAGKHVREVVDSDRYYCYWLFSQPWFKGHYPWVYAEARRILAKRLSAEVLEDDDAERPRTDGFTFLTVKEFVEGPARRAEAGRSEQKAEGQSFTGSCDGLPSIDDLV